MAPLPSLEDHLIATAGPAAHRHKWATFLDTYARGQWAPEKTPSRPPLNDPRSGVDSGTICGEDNGLGRHSPPSDSSDAPTPVLYATTEITDNVAQKVHNFWVQHGYLPPPRSPYENLREKVIEEYDLLGPVQAGNIQSAVDLISAFFPDALITFTLFNNRMQTFVALTGPEAIIQQYGIQTHTHVGSETSLCGHAVLLGDQIMYVPNLGKDWRFRSNPYTLGGIQSYIGSAVSLRLDPLNSTPTMSDLPEKIGIGALNILFVAEPLEQMTPTQQMVVTNVTQSLETQLRATWEGHIRTREAKMRRAISDLIQEAFVGDQIEAQQLPKKGDFVSQGNLEARTGDSWIELAQHATDKLVALSEELDILTVIDVRSLSLKFQNDSIAQYELNSTSPHPLSTIASATREASVSGLDPTPTAILSYFNNRGPHFTFDRANRKSGFEIELPDDVHSHLIMPFFAHTQPLFAMIAVSKRSTIRSATVNLAQSVGAILLARVIQSRVIEADTAKTAFLSSISHELRTPLHSVVSGLKLVRGSLDSGQWDDARSLLSLVETSGQTLYRILNDILDFGKAQNAKDDPSRLVSVDLLKLATDAAQMCLNQSHDMDPNSNLFIEYEQRDWQVTIDDARYQRIIINGLSNAIKFCKTGQVTLSLSTTPDCQQVITRVKDTGIGIEEKMLRRVLEPFTKQDPHSPGSGLGLYITQNLVNRMGGSFAIRSSPGSGTVFEAILPVRFEVITPSVDRSRMIVQELQEQVRYLHPNRTACPKRSNEKNPSELKSPTSIQTSPKPPSTSQPSPLSPKHAAGADVMEREPLRVLVVDDNVICLRILMVALKKGPTSVICKQAINGQKAVDAFRTFQPHLVLTDVSMPVKDGITASQEMRDITEQLGLHPCRIYAITGLGSSDPRLQSLAVQGLSALDGWLVKGQDDLKVIHKIVAQVSDEAQVRISAVSSGVKDLEQRVSSLLV